MAELGFLAKKPTPRNLIKVVGFQPGAGMMPNQGSTDYLITSILLSR